MNATPTKPPRPSPGFPLSAHANGQWYTTRRIAGRKRFFYFGEWAEDPRGDRALATFRAVEADIRAGREPLPSAPHPGTVTAGEIVERFLNHCQARLEAGEIGPREFGDLRLATLIHFLDAVGEGTLLESGPRRLEALRSHLSGRMGVPAFNRNVTKVRAMLRWAHERAKLIRTPLHDDPSLRRKPARLARRERRERDATTGPPIFTPDECRALVDAATAEGGQLPAFVLLGLNAGMGQSHVADLPLPGKAVDLGRGFVDWVRTKTEELCQFPLWPATVQAIEAYLPTRPEPADPTAAGLLFLTRFGRQWVREPVRYDEAGAVQAVSPDDAIGKEFDKLQKRLGLKQKGRGFYALRHTFSTAANDVQDRDATRRIMGHGLEGMDRHYVREIPAARLAAVTSYVGRKLLGSVD